MGDKISIWGTFLQEVSRFVGSDDKDFTRKQRILLDLNLNELVDFTTERILEDVSTTSHSNAWFFFAKTWNTGTIKDDDL